VRHLLILISILLLSSPVIGQSSKYESVSQCVLQTMTEKKLTGKKMFEMVKEECERILGKVETGVKKRQKGVLFFREGNSGFGWYEDGDEKKDRWYVGEIENGEPNGQGTLTKPNGDKYVGEFRDGKRNGQGTYTWSNGDKYEGEWKDGKRIGQGTFTWANGNKYEGEWKDEKRTGQGKYIFSNGGKVVGEFRGGKYWNTKEYDKEGNIIRTWVNGKGIKP